MQEEPARVAIPDAVSEDCWAWGTWRLGIEVEVNKAWWEMVLGLDDW